MEIFINIIYFIGIEVGNAFDSLRSFGDYNTKAKV